MKQLWEAPVFLTNIAVEKACQGQTLFPICFGASMTMNKSIMWQLVSFLNSTLEDGFS
jgi:hypothetical protein